MSSIPENKKTSLLIRSQLPEYLRDDPEYDKFVAFLQAYYEWLENSVGSITLTNPGRGYTYPPTVSIVGNGEGAAANAVLKTDDSGSIDYITLISGGSGYTNASIIISPASGNGSINATATINYSTVLNTEVRGKNILNYQDIDKTTDEFIEYFVNDFLQYFPDKILISKKEAVKLARQMYSNKGTFGSYEFFFRIAYNSDFDAFNTKDAVFRASAGIWYVPRSVKLFTSDPRFLNIKHYRLFGETSKTIATIENSTNDEELTDVYISNIERLFVSGEFVRVVDNQNQDVLIDGKPLRAKIVGAISSVNVDPNNRGAFYKVGDPVVFFGGLNAPDGHGAEAYVGEVTKGSIKRIRVLKQGLGYRPDPLTLINIYNGNGANARVSAVNTAPATIGHVAYLPIDVIAPKRLIPLTAPNYGFQPFPTNINTRLKDAFHFTGFDTFPIKSVAVTNGGGGITVQPTVEANSMYQNYIGELSNLKNMGILGPIQIRKAGNGYKLNDPIILRGGSGFGGQAYISGVNTKGGITNVAFQAVGGGSVIPLGGMGYKTANGGLPIIEIQSSNVLATGAELFIPSILGDGAEFFADTIRVGEVVTINITDAGQDYIAAPNVSLRVVDTLVYNVDNTKIPQRGEIVYQGSSEANAAFKAYVDSCVILRPNYNNINLSLYRLRMYDYTAKANTAYGPLYLPQSDNEFKISTIPYYPFNDGSIFYGDGNAKATAVFLNGFIIGAGKYLNATGSPSEYSIIQSSRYNNYTYQITAETYIAKYKKALLQLLHPAGLNVFGRFAIKSNSQISLTQANNFYYGAPLMNYTGNALSRAKIHADFDNRSNNIIQISNLGFGQQVSEVFVPNVSQIEIKATQGPFNPNILPPRIRGTVISVDDATNQIVIDNSPWLTFGNVAIVSATSNSNQINIISVTNQYDYINNGEYSNSQYHLMDVIFAGDRILVNNNSPVIVTDIDYVKGSLNVTPAIANTTTNSYLSVSRTLDVAQYEVNVYGPTLNIDLPTLATETDDDIVTEFEELILVG